MIPTHASKALMYVTRLYRTGKLAECFDQIPNVDCEAASSDLQHIRFIDGSAISINPVARTLTVD